MMGKTNKTEQSEAMARYEAMLELTSQSVEDGEKLYTEKELKERAKEAWDEAVWKWSNPDKETDSWFDEWYEQRYGK